MQDLVGDMDLSGRGLSSGGMKLDSREESSSLSNPSSSDSLKTSAAALDAWLKWFMPEPLLNNTFPGWRERGVKFLFCGTWVKSGRSGVVGDEEC